MTKAFILPFAGGSSHYFEYIRRTISCDLEVIYLNIHEKEHTEVKYSSIQELSESLYEKIASEITDEDYFLFGHSMGSLLVYEITLLLEKKHIHKPKFVVVSGLIAPDILSLKNKVRVKEHINTNIANNKSFISDIELVNNYELNCLVELKTRLIVMYGNDDMYLVNKDEVKRWKRFTSDSFEIYEFSGDHFYFHNRINRKKIAVLLSNKIKG